MSDRGVPFKRDRYPKEIRVCGNSQTIELQKMLVLMLEKLEEIRQLLELVVKK